MSLESIEFVHESDPRCPCVLLLDTSSSMSGEPISKLNEGLQTFKQDLLQDPVASLRVEIAIVTFHSGVTVVQDFITADEFTPPALGAGGSTSMGAGIQKALEMVRARKDVYQANAVAYYRPWMFMITDGAPTDSVSEAAQRVHQEEEKKGLAFFAVGVQGADMVKLESIAVREPLKLQGLNFAELFLWLSSSMQQISQSNPGDQVALPRLSWAEI